MTGHKKPGTLVTVAVIIGAHGVRGDVKLKSFTDDPEACVGYGPLCDAKGRTVLTPLRKRVTRTHIIVTPDVPREKEAWDALKGTALYVPRHVLPTVDADEFYIDDLTGLAVFDPAGSQRGTVKAVHNFGAGDVVEIDTGTDIIMIPFTTEDIPEIDLDKRRLTVASFDLWTG